MSIQLLDKGEIPAPKTNWVRRISNVVFISIASVLLINQVKPEVLNLPVFNLPVLSIFAAEPIVAPVVELQTFEAYPVLSIPAPSYNVSETLFNNSLTGKLTHKYHAPKHFNFTGALLTLNITNDELVENTDVVVAEILVNKSPIWRTSTPYGKLNTITKSSTTKNVTEFLSLFEQSGKIEVNVIEGVASKNVTFELTLDLYNDSTIFEGNAIFGSEGPADLIVDLTNSGKPFNFPSDDVSFVLPQLNSNVTSAKVSLLASATEAEILYFKNDIAKVGEPAVNGPLRYLNVYADDVYLTTIIPKPTLYHSDQISVNASKLWQPLAESGSYQGLSYEIDLFSILPSLWVDDVKLEIEVVSPIQMSSVGPGSGLPHPIVKGENVITGDGWLISGNLLAWESSAVVEAIGEIIESISTQQDKGLVVEPPVATPFQPAIKNQIAKSSIKSDSSYQLNFTLIDNSTVSYTITSNFTVNAFLTKQEKTVKKVAGPPGSGLGSTTTSSTFTLITGSENKYEIVDTDTGLIFQTLKKRAEFPFTFDETATESQLMFKGPTSSNSIKSSIRSDIKTKVNGTTVSSYKVDEKITLDDITGAVTDIKLDIQNVGEAPIKREVAATNGVITKDTTTV